MPPAWPEDEYLLLLGRVVYSVASIEGSLIFDLPRMPLPVQGLGPGDLAGKTTTTIGRRLVELSGSVVNESWQEYLKRGGEALRDLGPQRNAVLHARPATADGQQRLYRWRLEPTEVLAISNDHLLDLLSTIEMHREALSKLRPPLE